MQSKGKILPTKKWDHILEPDTHYCLNMAKMRTTEPRKVPCSDGNVQKTFAEKKMKTKTRPKLWERVIKTYTF